MDKKKLFADGMFAYETDKDWLPMRISFRVKDNTSSIFASFPNKPNE